MYYRNDVISYLQSNKILAVKLDHAVAGVKMAVTNQIETMGAGATRALYYTSCFTDEYQDVCKRQQTEDRRFLYGVVNLLQRKDVVYELLKVYFEEIFKNKTAEQLDRIKKMLMAANVHIAASSLSRVGFALATATSVAVGMGLRLEMSVLVGRIAGIATVGVSLYGIVQKAADSARRLEFSCPAYYATLYTQELEMMYFLIEPLFQRAGALKAHWASDEEVADIIVRMIR
ncbi:hypothetical protein KQ929_17940 [Leclercia pneumoniae]|uniref:Uncharacterized protein n=1 Tax=Leclercia pneumoniae TaxID=2815358 RepID=A0ABX8JS18_9ENTR|nr:hypothetical protein [Leclercia pneumoniae]QSW35985.1 hypothetical protein JZ655_02570 [Leclercia pneumoniae]QWW79095.1 hypothetical protein KQ929_17940 [Leclercia pneumoniae]